MTTLPQTTPIRLPRAGAPSQLALPGNAGPMVSSTSVPAIQMSGADVWRVIRANLWLIVLFVTLGAVGGYFLNGYLEEHYSTYTAVGVVRILQQESADPMHPAPELSGNYLQIMQSTEVQKLRSESVLDNILKEADNPIRQTNFWKVVCAGDPQKAHQKFTKNLSVTSIPESQLIRVSITATDKQDTATLVKVLVDRSILDEKQRIRDKTDADRKRVYDNLTNAKINLRTKTAEVNELGQTVSRDGGDIRGGTTMVDIETGRQVDRQIQLKADSQQIESAFNAFKDKLSHGEVPDRVLQMVNQDRDVMQYSSMVDSIDTRLSELGTTTGSASPATKQLNQQRTIYVNKLNDTKAEKTAQYQSTVDAELTAQRDSINASLAGVNERIDRLRAQTADLSSKSAQFTLAREEETNLRESVNRYEKELNEIDQLVRNQELGVLEWFEPPTVPDSRSFPNLAAVMSSAIGIGLFLSLGIAFLREVTDTTVRSPRDITRVGQMNFLGMVPHEADDPQSSGARLPLVIFEAPHSMMAEQLRQVRTRLQHAASLDTTRSILVTSPGPGDGKSTIAVNLAAGLALNGRRILLVDSNFRRPELHRIFGIGNEAGFSDVLNDVNAFTTSVRETSVPNLSVMASGPKPSNPTELLESQLLLDFIERALEEYDHVIFDSGPMLFVSESVALAPRVDGVITVVKARTSSRGVLQRMRDGLRAVKAEHLGVVLNGVRSQAGGYYGRSIKTYYEYQNAD